MFGHRRLACSFCGRGAAEIEKLVAGPRVYICDRCVEAARQIMEGVAPPDDRAAGRGRMPRTFGWLRRAVGRLGPGPLRRHAVAQGTHP